MKWKVINGFEKYKISDCGIVKNIQKGTILYGNINHDGYVRVKLSSNKGFRNVFVHRLVAEAFLGTPVDDTLEVNHIDENKENNHVSNLEWVTHTGNMRHSCDKPCKCINDGKIYPSARDAAKAYGLNAMSVREVARGKKAKIHNMVFEYVA